MIGSADDCSTRLSWATSLLKHEGYPTTAANTTAVVAWELKESGPSGGASYNPLNTTWDAPGSTKFNSVGVRNYVSCKQGMDATGATLRLAPYLGIRDALEASDDPSVLAHEPSLETWGTKSIPSNLISEAAKLVG